VISPRIARKVYSVLYNNLRKGSVRRVLNWVTFLLKSFIFASFAKLIEFNTLLNYLNLQEGERVCDLGSGLGINDVLLSLSGAKIYAVDIDRDSLKYARNLSARLRVNVNHCTSDLNQGLSFKSESFDKAVSYCVFEHLGNPDDFLSEVNRILLPRGTLALSVDSFSNNGVLREFREVHRRVCDVKKYYTLNEIEPLLGKYGFAVKKSSYIVRSPISNWLFQKLLHYYFRSEIDGQQLSLRLFKLLCPLAFVLCLLSDRFYNSNQGGYWLTLVAVKEAEA
jgi:ubiquinone/menaquinone biosynthesis C-methylase UbiE